MAKATVQSIEPNIADMANGWLKSYKLDYKLEQESLNGEIDKALSDYFTKNGGAGANRPDAKLLLRCKNLQLYPVLIEYKGYKDKLVKLDSDGQVENKTSKNEPNFKNINGYAVNGAVHYANALLHHTSYTEIIAVGMTGYKDDTGQIQYEIGVYIVSKSNFGIGQKIGDFSDLSFLSSEYFDAFIGKVKALGLSPTELEKIKEQREKEIDASLVKLNNDIYQNEKGLGENDRVYLVAASIIATLGIPGKVAPLEKSELKSSTEAGNSDGDIIVRKINAFLNEKNIPEEKRSLILRTLQNTLTTENINKVSNGESQLKRVFSKIVDDLGIYYKIGLTTDFTGKLFNEMYGWLGFSQDKLNDVVLTPSYIATLLARLARVNKNSYVWDFATGSAGLLVAAMNEMLNDAKRNITSPEELAKKEVQIKAEQLLGLEMLSSVYMLAILNMILMGDGSSNILNKDSLLEFDGKYGFGKTNEPFPADAFILNPPYSATGNGMNFVEKALGMMHKGYAAIIIQGSAGTGKAKEINQRILKEHTLLASIKMPIDLFIGKSSVQTYIYVFKVKEAHHEDQMVRFIDFSNDGYTRTNRKKSTGNLKDTGRAKERYDELVKLVHFGKSKLNILAGNEYYEATIDPKSGSDWNKVAPIDTKPLFDDFKLAVSNYLAWDIGNLIKQNRQHKEKSEVTCPFGGKLNAKKWESFRLGDLFDVNTSKKRFDANKVTVLEKGVFPYVVRMGANNGQKGFIDEDECFLNEGNTISFGQDTATMFYQEHPYFTGDKIKILKSKMPKFGKKNAQFFICTMEKAFSSFSWGNSSFNVNILKNQKLTLPINETGEIDFDFMEAFIAELEKDRISTLDAYLVKSGLRNSS